MTLKSKNRKSTYLRTDPTAVGLGCSAWHRWHVQNPCFGTVSLFEDADKDGETFCFILVIALVDHKREWSCLASLYHWLCESGGQAPLDHLHSLRALTHEARSCLTIRKHSTNKICKMIGDCCREVVLSNKLTKEYL